MKSFLAAVVVACCATAAHAQGASVRPMPMTGELLRVTPVIGDAYTGRLIGLGGDTIVLHCQPGDSAVRVRASEQRVEVNRRPRERWSAYGALVGIGLGIVSAQVSRPAHAVQQTERAVVGSAAGGVFGGLVGFTLAPRRWQRVNAPHVAVTPLPPPAPEPSRGR